eukprot:TRINITY_DN9109_c2_g1_i2.p1 TRINITY_DN9109_c2_g1~~TRINITY_DN9109_c2_g1_i2.p1  ORF type:complete len:253 (+),score=31.57 TRINITY_DN9109_c2_g1_i2:49-807(+)
MTQSDIENAPLVNEGAVWRKHVVPRRLEITHLSWVFLWASVSLMVEFIMLYQGTFNDSIINAVGMMSCLMWLHGFLMLDHWMISLGGGDFSKIPHVALFGAILKTIASVFFNMQPITALANNDLGYSWSNLTGILFFHTGNMVSIFDMMIYSRNLPGGFNYKNPFCADNIPVYAMWVYLAATSLLVPANFWTCSDLNISVPSSDTISAFQITGGALLSVGSIMFLVWAGPLPSFGIRPAGMPGELIAIESSF